MVISSADNGRDAISILQSQPDIDLVLMDVRMKPIDGLRATASIKARFPETRIAIVSQYDAAELRAEAREEAPSIVLTVTDAAGNKGVSPNIDVYVTDPCNAPLSLGAFAVSAGITGLALGIAYAGPGIGVAVALPIAAYALLTGIMGYLGLVLGSKKVEEVSLFGWGPAKEIRPSPCIYDRRDTRTPNRDSAAA